MELKKILPEYTAPALSRNEPNKAATSAAQPSIQSSIEGEKPDSGKHVVIIDDCDDEEPLPRKKIKTEPADTGENANSIVSINQSTSPIKIKTENEETSAKLSLNRNPPTSSETPPTATKQSAKDKEKARLLLKLEAIEVKQRLMELDTEAGE